LKGLLVKSSTKSVGEEEKTKLSEVRSTNGDEFGDSGAAGAAEAGGGLCGSALLAFVGLESEAGEEEEKALF
jgi:hypothetical protein